MNLMRFLLVDGVVPVDLYDDVVVPRTCVSFGLVLHPEQISTLHNLYLLRLKDG
jgi:hypothetical protein